jgi:hypothetical protein
MDNLCYLNSRPQPREDDLDSDSDGDSIAAAADQMPATPTKRRSNLGDERTPRASNCTNALITPRPTPRPHLRPASRPDRSSSNGPSNDQEAVVGCTLSFLLRVPELASLASRVVQAEVRRREKAKAKAKASPSATATGVSPDPAGRAGKRRAPPASSEGSVPKVKRLFLWAICQLYHEGSIILWDGPVLPLLEPDTVLDSSVLYRMSQLDTTTSGRSSSASSRLVLAGHHDQLADYMEDLSDPPSDEEAYASLSTAYLATQVELAIRSLTALQTRQNRETESAFLGPAVSRRRLLPLPGPTKEDITTHLNRGDDRWTRINGWAVQEALEWLRDHDRVWCVSEDGGGRWELCS